MLRCRNATQTSVVLEWDPINLATAECKALSLFRNGQKAGNIPDPQAMTSTKISGLAVDKEYVFHLVLRTSAGTFTSEKVIVKTHKMTDLSGITVTPGILPPQLRESLTKAVERIGAKIADSVRIDTTHFVTTEPRGVAWEKAVEQNIPVVRPEWVEGCERGGRVVGVRGYYLDADPRLRDVGQTPGVGQPQAQPPNQQPTPPQKDTPAPAATNGHAEVSAEVGRNNATGTPPPAPPAKDELAESSKATSQESEESEKLEEEDTTDDRDQRKANMPANLRPGSAKLTEDEASDGARTPGGASFQDVAL